MKQNNGKIKTAVLVLCIMGLILCGIKLYSLQKENSRLLHENRFLKDEVQTLSEQLENEETETDPQSILNLLKNSFDKQDWDAVVKTFLFYKDQIQNTEVYQQAEELYQQAKQRITDSDVFQDLEDKANKLKENIKEKIQNGS